MGKTLYWLSKNLLLHVHQEESVIERISVVCLLWSASQSGIFPLTFWWNRTWWEIFSNKDTACNKTLFLSKNKEGLLSFLVLVSQAQEVGWNITCRVTNREKLKTKGALMGLSAYTTWRVTSNGLYVYSVYIML